MSKKPSDAAVNDFAIALKLVVRRLRAATPSHEISWAQTSVLGRLMTDGSMTTAELARAENMKPQSMGAIIASLEEAGLIIRKPHPTDGRQVNIVPTAKGLALRDQNRAARRTWLSEAITQLDKEEQATLFAASDIIRRLGEM